MQLIEKNVTYKVNAEGLLIEHAQSLPDWWLSDLETMRNNSVGRRMGDMECVAVVPEVLVDKWRNEGFDVFKESASAICARLKAEDATKFLTTLKRV